MAKFTIDPSPSFAETVVFRMPGGKTGSIRVDFRYMDAEAYGEHFQSMKGCSDAEIAESIATGWDAADEFGKAALDRLFKAYPTAARAFFATFRNAIYGADEKN